MVEKKWVEFPDILNGRVGGILAAKGRKDYIVGDMFDIPQLKGDGLKKRVLGLILQNPGNGSGRGPREQRFDQVDYAGLLGWTKTIAVKVRGGRRS